MNVLVIGNGGREHALAWKLRASSRVDRLFVAPGNGGTSRIATNLPISVEDTEALLQAAVEEGVDLTVVGPETPLAGGIVDRFRQHGLAIFGSTREASRLEWSKAFARELMASVGVPCPDFKVFSHYDEAVSFVERHGGPLVVKTDGLAAGKGSLVCADGAEALQALHLCMQQRAFGVAGDTVVVEEWLTGPEVSVFAFCDGEHLSELVAACDYKRALDGDLGPNTGGMGSYSPPLEWDPQLSAEVLERVMLPVVRAMAQRGTPYQGVLYAGLMLTSSGPQVLEFNCRLGDPETQVLLPLLKMDLLEAMEACLEGRIHRMPLEWSQGACVGVVMASQGYPDDYPKGLPVHGIEEVSDEVLVFHAGTRLNADGAPRYVTDGGRVLTVASLGNTVSEAREKVYRNIGRIHFEGAQYRRDIALRAAVPTV